MSGKLETLFTRIPWRLIIAGLGAVLVVDGVASLLSADLAKTETVIRVAEHGIGSVLVGGVILIAVIMSR
jgi:hypothetical protein